MSEPEDFTVSVETVNELHRCRADEKVRLDVSSSTFPTTTSERASDVQAAAAERLLGAISLFVNEVMLKERLKERDDPEKLIDKWIHILHLSLDRTPQHLLTSPRSHSVQFEERLAQGLIKRFGLKMYACDSALNRLGTDLYHWIDIHREDLKDQYRLEKSSSDRIEVKAKGYGYPSAARILGEPRPRKDRVEPRIRRGK